MATEKTKAENLSFREQMATWKLDGKRWLHKNRKGITDAVIQVRPELIPFSIQNELNSHGGRPLSRNSRCPCGSGKRFKHCCMAVEKQNKERASHGTEETQQEERRGDGESRSGIDCGVSAGQ